MEDMEKNRVTYVQQMEAKLGHLQTEYEKYKAIAERWEPQITVQANTETNKTTFGLQFGGKFVHATVTHDWLIGMDNTGATSAIVDALVESLVVSEIRKIVAPEVARVQQGAQASEGAGKW